MSFWLLVVIMVTLIVLCWGGGYGIYRLPDGRGTFPGGLLFILGLILFIVLVVMFINYDSVATIRTTR